MTVTGELVTSVQMSETPPKVDLALLPTPLHRLNRLSEELELDLWIKRDDMTGFAMGGNKGRKVEYLIADAMRLGSEVVVTCGALQSNFVRQLGAACRVCGLRLVADVMTSPFDSAAGPAASGIGKIGGNVLLDNLLDVELRLHPDGDWETLYAHAAKSALGLRSAGVNVYEVPVGGSSPPGAYAFHQAGLELQGQGVEFDWIVFPTSSGSTQVGLAHAFRVTNTRVLGIACDPEPEIAVDFADLSAGLADLLGEVPLDAEEFLIDFDSVGDGYGVPSHAGNEATKLLATREAIFLDPVYTAKAFAGLTRLAASGAITGRVVFWHTGGIPALFATD